MNTIQDPIIAKTERQGSPVSFEPEFDEVEEITKEVAKVFKKFTLTMDISESEIQDYIELMLKEVG